MYTQDFAVRFKLPAEGVEQLAPGVQAIAYRIVNEVGEAPSCHLDFYLDDVLDLDYPAGEEGARTHADAENPLFFSDHLDEKWERVRGNLHTLGCRSQGKCESQTGSLSAYWRHLTPGTAFQSYQMLCSMFDPREMGTLEMWLLRAGVDSQKVIDVMHSDGDGVLAFRIPTRLLEHVATQTRQAVSYFSKPLPPERARGAFQVPPKR